MRLILILALFPLLATAGTERVDLNTHIEADVIYKDATGEWTARKATFDKFSDARIIVCYELKDKVVADCLLIDDDGDVLMKPLRMLEEKV